MNPDGPTSSPAPGAAPLHPVEWAEQAGVSAEVLSRLNQRLEFRRRRRRTLAGLAAAVALGVGTWTFLPSLRAPGRPSPASIVVLNAPNSLELPDGSVADVRPGGSLRVEFSDTVRRVILERGEACFTVVKNPRRPFVVQAGGFEARALGTIYSVALKGSSAEVIVAEGTVALDRTRPPADAVSRRETASAPRETLLTAGHRALVTASSPTAPPQVETISAAALHERHAWRIPVLEFSGTPLPEAVASLNRYGKIRLVVGDARLGEGRLSGVIRADNTESLLRLLRDEHGVVSDRHGNGDIVLSRRR